VGSAVQAAPSSTPGAIRGLRRPLTTGLVAGVFAMAADYLGHALIALPLLPEQAGNLLLRVLPLPIFELLLKTLSVLARPLLLIGATIVIIAAYGAAAWIIGRWRPDAFVPLLTGLVAIVSAAVALIARSSSDSWPGLVGEVVVLAGVVPAVDALFAQLDSPAVDDDRRLLLRNLVYGAAGIAILGIGYAAVRRLATALAVREGSRVPSEVTDVKDFYVVSKNLGGDPVVDATGWHLQLPGRSLTYEQLLAMPAQQLELTLECISNDVGGTLISNGLWKGPRVTDLLGEVPPNAVFLLMESADGYTESFPLRELTPDHLLATHLNGAPLTPPHGYPARFIFPGHYGMKQPKWVTKVRFSASDQRGYWENNGWDEQAIVKTMSRIDQPVDGAALAKGTVSFSGIAFAGARRISQVELSWDDGGSWTPAELQSEFSPYAWRFWHLTASLPAGHLRISVRARDGEGTIQSSQPAPTLPNGADGYHTITIDLA
jgi:DMSO/TMAO reductase YedYZ molybdopterin-dependent catalytic subunit